MLKSTKTAATASGVLGMLFSWVPLHPNAITLSSVFLALFAYLAFDDEIPEAKIISLLLFLFAFGFDAIDGAVARAKNLVTKEGAFIDGIADRVVEFLLLLAILRMFALDYFMQSVVLCILFFGTCMTAFVKAYSEHKGLLKHEQAEKMGGVLERTERSLLLLVAFVLLIFGYAQYGTYTLYVTAALSFITFLQRFFRALCH